MARYYFHLQDRDMTVSDEEGREMASHAAMVAATLHEARSLIGHDAFAGTIRLCQRIEVQDEAQVRVHSLAFADAVEIFS